MAEKDKKYFWLKLKRDFFKRHDTKIIESYGSEYLLFYMKLLCESLDHDGRLRFSEKVPYSISMLATVAGADEEVAKKAVEVLIDLKLITKEADGTFIMNEASKMTGSETYWAKKKREQKELAEQGEKPKPKKNKKFNNANERSYQMDELEKKLLDTN